jgi:hypothetical protein
MRSTVTRREVLKATAREGKVSIIYALLGSAM